MDIILKETKKVVITLLIIDLVYIIVSLITGYFDISVIFGALFGFAYTVINFMLLGQIVSKAIVKKPKSAKFYIQTHYTIRLMLAGVALAIAIISPYIDHWIVILSMFAPKFFYYTNSFYECFKKRRK